MSEEQKMTEQQVIADAQKYVYAYPQIPYYMMDSIIDKNLAKRFKFEFNEILKLYGVYKFGNEFRPEGSNGDYVPSTVRYKKAAMILNKEARFFFSNSPSFNVNMDDVTGDYSEENAIIQDYLDKVLELTNFHGKLMKGVKDCFIGKRIAIVVDFNEDIGISITFLKSMNFLYEFGVDEKLDKFVSFYEVTGSDILVEQMWVRKSYERTKNGVFVVEETFDGTGSKIKTTLPKTKLKFDVIPAVVILNDGLTGDIRGESELLYLMDYEAAYSKLANSDMDSERKSMHPIRYTIDASNNSTKKLSTSPGSYWDLQTDEDKPNETSISAKVGMLEAQMNYSPALKTTLDRLENEMYAELDVPNITSEQLAGVITSGKTIQALYWGLTVRCDEKMLAWAAGLREIAYIIIEGAKYYKNCVKQYTDKAIPEIPYDVIVENNYPIPEDVKEEKELDITEIDAKIMSRKAYLKKWRNLNDSEAEAELEQIKLESEMLDNTYLNYSTTDTVNTDMDASNDTDGSNDGVDENNVQSGTVTVQENESANARNVGG